MEAVSARIDTNYKALEQQRRDDSEGYMQQKVQLEANIQQMQVTLQEMKVKYLLNTERLEYDFRVFQERDVDNEKLLYEQKQKMKKLQDTVTMLKNKHKSLEQKFKAENATLSEDYKRITQQYKDLQSKYQHFHSSDRKKYDDLFINNVQTAGQIAYVMTYILIMHRNEIVKGNKMLYEQQLQIPAPVCPVIDVVDPIAEAIKLGATRDNVENAGGGVSSSYSFTDPNETSLYEYVYNNLCNQSGVLMHEKVIRMLTNVMDNVNGIPLQPENALGSRFVAAKSEALRHALTSLGITNKGEIDVLCGYISRTLRRNTVIVC